MPHPRIVTGDLNMPPAAVRRHTGLRALASAATYPSDVPTQQLDHVLTDDPGLQVRPAGRHRSRSPIIARSSSICTARESRRTLVPIWDACRPLTCGIAAGSVGRESGTAGTGAAR